MSMRNSQSDSPVAIAFIFARGGSKGVPRKNIRNLNGKPLIAYSIETALACPLISKVVVSTDDPAIAEVATRYGAEVPFLRPAELATDTASEWLAWQHAIKEVQKSQRFDVFVSLPTTSPLRNVSDVEAALKALDEQTDCVISVTPSARNPWYNMVRKEENGFVEVVNKNEKSILGRQSAPQVWDMTTVVYAARPEYILENDRLFSGKVKSIEVPRERALDIDTEYDFQIAEFLVSQSLSR